MYLMSAFATRGAGMNSLPIHDKSPVINFFLRFNRLLIFTRFGSFSVAVSFDVGCRFELVPLESAIFEITMLIAR